MLACIMSVPGRGQVTGDQYQSEASEGIVDSEINASATRSSNDEDEDHPRAHACDESLSTYWRSDLMNRDDDRPYIVFDLGRNHETVRYISILANHADQSPRTITIKQSNNQDGDGNTLLTVNDAYVEGKVVREVTITQRYVRLEFTRRGGTEGDHDYRRIRLFDVTFYTQGFNKDNTSEITI